MKVIKKSNNTTTFDNLYKGTTFILPPYNEVYMKIETQTGKDKSFAVNLSTGVIHTFEPHIRVSTVDGTFTVE